MKPKSPHWADIAAARVVQTIPENQSTVTVASGITPSGTVHIGNFREVITVDMVARALRDMGKQVRFIYSWDDFDTLRKVPVNLPNQEMLKEHMRQPISRVPDPFGKTTSYARHNEMEFEKDLEQVGIAPLYLYQSEKYQNGEYAHQIRQALEQKDSIRKILDQYRKEPLESSWLPTQIYCEKCGRDTVKNEAYDGDWGYSYECESCGHKTKTDIRTTKNLKLSWRTDWPMRWAFEGVDFEPGGKDHSSEGGSFDTAKQIVKEIWNRNAPQYVQYDFVSIKGIDGKMSSSKGVLITLGEALKVYAPEMIRWIFATQRLNHDFSLAFDQDVIKVHDEFDRAEKQAFDPASRQNPKLQAEIRAYELALVDPKQFALANPPYRPSFRELCNRLQLCGGDIEKLRTRFYAKFLVDERDHKAFDLRVRCAAQWIDLHAPEEFRYKLNSSPKSLDCSDLESQALRALISVLESLDESTSTSQDLNQKIYDTAIKATGVDAKQFFRVVYQKLISRDQGPRLPTFILEIGKEKCLELLK